MIKTLTLDGLMSVTIKQSAYDMARFCWVNNRSDADVFASCVNSECTENADNVLRIPAGEPRMLDTESYETLYLNGSGTVELITSAYSVCPFNRAAKGGGASLSGSAAYTINNAVDYPLMGLNLYGKSTQDGTPTPDAPVDIVSVGDSGFDIVLQGDNEFTVISCIVNNDIITSQPVSAAVKVGEVATFSVTATGAGLTYQWQLSKNGGNTWSNTGVPGNKTSKITLPKAEASSNGFQYRCIVTDANGNTVISYAATFYVFADDIAVKTGCIVLPYALCGIPVSEGGNYTDSNGQQWVCDELIYNADGTGKIIKNAGIYTFTGNENFALRNNDNGRCVYALANFLQYKYYSGTRAVSDKYVCIDTVYSAAQAISRLKIGEMCFYYDSNFPNPANTAMYFGSSCTTAADFKSEIAGSTIIYALAEPLEIELTAAEMVALRQLQTFDGVTNISNDSGADMDVKYCTDKSLSEYVMPVITNMQAQIDVLKSAVLSLGSNV